MYVLAGVLEDGRESFWAANGRGSDLVAAEGIAEVARQSGTGRVDVPAAVKSVLDRFGYSVEPVLRRTAFDTAYVINMDERLLEIWVGRGCDPSLPNAAASAFPDIRRRHAEWCLHAALPLDLPADWADRLPAHAAPAKP